MVSGQITMIPKQIKDLCKLSRSDPLWRSPGGRGGCWKVAKDGRKGLALRVMTARSNPYRALWISPGS